MIHSIPRSADSGIPHFCDPCGIPVLQFLQPFLSFHHSPSSVLMEGFSPPVAIPRRALSPGLILHRPATELVSLTSGPRWTHWVASSSDGLGTWTGSVVRLGTVTGIKDSLAEASRGQKCSPGSRDFPAQVDSGRLATAT